MQRGGDGNSRAQIVFKGRRGVGMAIHGRRSFLKGAEGWGWQFKGADSLHLHEFFSPFSGRG